MGIPDSAVSGLIGGIISALVGWVVWSLIAYWVGTSFLGGTATPGELLRTIGFAYTPNVLAFFSFIFCIGGLIALIGALWSLVAGIIAVRQALDFDTGRAIVTVILGWVALVAVAIVFGLLGFGLRFF